MAEQLSGRRVAALVARGFEQDELFEPRKALEQARVDDHDALLLPGVMNSDHLRVNPRAVAFVRQCFDAGKAITAVCHGPWTLIEADVVRHAGA
jgi:protease I